MRALVLSVLALGVASALGACGLANDVGLNGSCIVLANGGNKLCGEDAKAWCRSTEDARRGIAELGVPADTESQAACDGL